MRTRRFTAAIVVALLTAGLVGCSKDESGPARSAAKKFLDAWSGGDVAAASAATDSPDGPKQWLPTVQKQLAGAKVSFEMGDVKVDGDKASQPFTANWRVPGQEKPWSYENKLGMVKDGDQWKVQWDTTVIHPDLSPNQQFAMVRALPERAGILDRAGQPVFAKQKVVTVGIEPGNVPDLNALAGTLASVLAADKVTAPEIVADAGKAKPTAFVPVVTLREPRYLQVKPAIYDLPGTVFRSSERWLPIINATFGQPLLGRVGDVTAEVLKEAGPVYAAGDQLGTSGMQRAFNKQLAGTPSVTISLADPAGKPVKKLAEFAGKPGTPIKTTLDKGVQLAAEQALAGVTQQASIVAIKPSTGELLAVANSASAGFNIALEGKYPPGSTFKIITATALLQAGVVQPGSTVACPGELVVGGKRFINSDKFDLGNVPLRRAFAQSCNTTFTSLSAKLPAGALSAAAQQYGIGVDWKLPVASYDGAAPPPANTIEGAADAIGQGKVLVSPFSMALAAATLQKGSVPTPSLIAGQQTAPAQPPTALPAATVTPLREFARAVVTEGTAQAVLRGAAGVAGKTGTAEYGDAVPPRSHSWFAGYRGDLAFAVFIWDGASSGRPALPVAASFLGKAK